MEKELAVRARVCHDVGMKEQKMTGHALATYLERVNEGIRNTQ